MAELDRVPTLSLTDAERPAARSRFDGELRAALQEFGFACLTGHGVTDALIAEVYAAACRFFALDVGEKTACDGSPGGARGYTAFGVEHAKDSTHADLKEFFHIGRPQPDSVTDPAVVNRWPAAVPELSRCGAELFDALERCSFRILESLARSYGLPETTFAEMTRGGNHVLRILHYPPIPPAADPASLRAAPHEDINLVTLLCEASDAGLEILRPDGTWLAVDAAPGQIVIDAGDMLARVTNGMVPATTHRVVNPRTGSGRSRYSLPFFAHPRSECDLSVLPQFVSEERPARTPPISAGNFLAQRLREIGLA